MIPVITPRLDGKEQDYLRRCIETGWISSEGPFVEQVEDAFAAAVSRRHGVACSSGSAAIDLAVAAVGLGPDDEVILPSFTIISPAASIVRAGATPVLVDADPITWNMDVNQVESRITPRTKAILIVHIYGLPTDMAPVLELASRHGLILIEDAAEMHGQTYRDRPCGSFGDLSTFSFYPNKHITTGEGGMVVTDDPILAQRCRAFRNLCFQKERRFVHEELGWNYRLTNLQAALGLAQLERLAEHVARKREMGRRYHARLLALDTFDLPPVETADAENIYWVFGIVCRDAISQASVWMERLAEHQIGTRPFFWPMHEQPVFRKMDLFLGESYPHAERLARRGIYLPSGLGLTDQQINQVCDTIEQLVDASRQV